MGFASGSARLIERMRIYNEGPDGKRREEPSRDRILWHNVADHDPRQEAGTAPAAKTKTEEPVLPPDTSVPTKTQDTG